MLDKFLKSGTNHGDRSRVNVEVVIHTLQDTYLEAEHDAAYETLLLLDGTYGDDTQYAVSALYNRESDSFARWYALDALAKIEVTSEDIIAAVEYALSDPDAGVQQVALQTLKSLHLDNKVSLASSLVRLAKAPNAFVEVRLQSLSLAMKLQGFYKTFSNITRPKK